MRFFKKKRPLPYDPETQEPVVRKSICSGEMTAGILDKQTGKFHELMLLENQQALKDFCRQMGIAEIRTIY